MYKIKPFLVKYNWEGINSPSAKDDWKQFEKNNPKIAVNVLYETEMQIGPVYILKIQSKLWKINYSVNDFKRRRMALSCSKKLP